MVIKGVNRNVIEIVNTGSATFERAILFVSEGGSEKDTAALESSAKNFLAQTRLRHKRVIRRQAFWRVAGYILSAAAGAGGMAALLTLL